MKQKTSYMQRRIKPMQSIEEIYKQYFEIVNKYLFCLTRNSDIAEELTQETFYRAVKKIHTFRGNCKISVWLCEIAKNLWYDELRKNKKLKNVEEQDIFTYQEENVEETIIANEEKISLYKKLQKLNEQTREVMYLRITGELSFKEIAEVMNKTENWARVTYYRGKQRLKEMQ